MTSVEKPKEKIDIISSFELQYELHWLRNTAPKPVYVSYNVGPDGTAILQSRKN